MHIHYLQHVAFEGLGSMQQWFIKQNFQVSATHLYAGESLPELYDIDWLIVMGGPMGVNDEHLYPWLADEKIFIEKAITSGKIVLGICLGAQLIAQALGADVAKNPHPEIGWFPLQVHDEAGQTAIGKILQSHPLAFHWHGDRFDIPTGATPLARSNACDNQGFIYRGRVVGLQFHLETTRQSASDLIAHCGDELDGSDYVQGAADMLSQTERFLAINQVMTEILEVMRKT